MFVGKAIMKGKFLKDLVLTFGLETKLFLVTEIDPVFFMVPAIMRSIKFSNLDKSP